MNTWVTENIVWLLGLAASAGYMKHRLDMLDKMAQSRIEEIVAKIDAQDERVREFWQEKWPIVERHGERIGHLEKETNEIRVDLHGLQQVVHRHIGGNAA